MSNPNARIMSVEPVRDTVLPTNSVDYTNIYGPMIQGVQKYASSRVSYALSTAESRNGTTQYYAELSALNCDIIKKYADSDIKISGVISGETNTPWDTVFACFRYDENGNFNGEVGTPDASIALDNTRIGFAISGIYNDANYDSTAQSVTFTLLDAAATRAGKWTYRIRAYSHTNTYVYTLNGTIGDVAAVAYERYTSQMLVEEYQSANYISMPRTITFENSGTWNIPDGVTQLTFFAYGGGGGGGAGGYSGYGNVIGSGGGGGGSGARLINSTVNVASVVNPNRTLTITIGAGGAGGTAGSINVNNQTAGTAGGTTTVTNPTLGTLVSLAGGGGGTIGLINSTGGTGGTGFFGGGGGAGNGGGPGGTGTSASGGAGGGINPGDAGNGAGGGGFGGRGYAFNWGVTETNTIYNMTCTGSATFYQCAGGGGGGPGGGVGNGNWNDQADARGFNLIGGDAVQINATGIQGSGGGGGTGGTSSGASPSGYCSAHNNPSSGGGAGAKGSVTIAYSFGTTGSDLYTTPGTYSWLCPPGVNSVSVLCIGGGGGGGGAYWAGGGGGGGGLGYRNNITVEPGQYYTIVVGAGGTGTTGGTGGAGGTSSFTATRSCSGLGGSGGVGIAGIGSPTGPYAGGVGGSFTGDGGGNGGTGGTSLNDIAGGGAGAGGYSGNGGNGGTNGAGTSGSGGGGGGAGSGGSISNPNGAAPSGGGTGIYGQGANGAGGASTVAGSGGSGGTTGSSNLTAGGSANTGGRYGGGGGGQSNDAVSSPGCNGGGGVVRIVYPGTTRQFPSTNVS